MAVTALNTSSTALSALSTSLDVIANNILLRTLGGREGVAIVASEENEEPVILRDDRTGDRKYCVLFDPLDGSSNLDICGGVVGAAVGIGR